MSPQSPYATAANRRVTPQSQPIPGEAQVANHAGGFAYAVDAWTQFQRFLILGSEGGTYYVGERELTKDNAQNVSACIQQDGKRAVDLIVAVSDAGRAPKNDPAIFALALASADANAETRHYALAKLPQVCRIPTHLFHFLEYRKGMRGMSRSVRRAIADWYQRWDADQLAYELVKYQSRDGWSHRDVLRVSHAKLGNIPAARWAIGADTGARVVGHAKGVVKPPRQYPATGELPAIIEAFTQAQTADAATLVKLIETHGLTREMVPTEALTKREVWEALLMAGKGMPLTALLRNLGNMAKCELLMPLSEASKYVRTRLKDLEDFKRSRVHPVAVLVAMKTYGSGRGLRGKGEWTVDPAVVDALDAAFYLAFGGVEPTGKRLLFGLDVSGSMSSHIANLPISCAEAAAVMALVSAKVETQYFIHGFADQFRDLGITPRMRLDDVLRITQGANFGATDCAVPMIWATDRKVAVDGFIVITDSETWAGRRGHPSQALRRYRETMGIPAKQVVMGMTATEISIADPKDPGSMDVVGFDTATPQVVSEILRA